MRITRHAAPSLATLPPGSDAPDPLRAQRHERQAGPGFAAAPRFAAESARVLFSPDVDLTETREAYVLVADVPGIHEEDLEISLAGDRLTLRGRRDEERHVEHATYFASERSYGAFHRQFVLPAGADLDRVRSELRDGVLTIVVPRRDVAGATGEACR